jgi:hypothetical protein
METPLGVGVRRLGKPGTACLAWHCEGLDCGCADQHARSERCQREALSNGERSVSLDQPGARAEREPGPLERELWDVGEKWGSVGAERRADRHHVDGDAGDEHRVSDVAADSGAVSSCDAERHRPRRDREVVGRQGDDVAKLGHRGLIGLKAQAEQMPDPELQRLDCRDDQRSAERRSPDRAVRFKGHVMKTALRGTAESFVQLCGSHCSTA